jgi:hypothetical protein
VVNKPGIVERWQLSQPGVIAAVVAGIILGGVAGATFKGSGMFFSNLILGGGLLVLLVMVGLGAVAATATRRTGGARILGVFVGTTVIATGVGYALAPRHRSIDDPFDHRGSATLQIAEYAATEWRAEARCRKGPRDSTVSEVSMLDVKIDERWVSVFLRLSPAATSVQAGTLTIGSYSPTERSADYSAAPGSGLDATLVGADGLSGKVRYSAVLMPNPARPTVPGFDRLTGTFEWACESTPSG